MTFELPADGPPEGRRKFLERLTSDSTDQTMRPFELSKSEDLESLCLDAVDYHNLWLEYMLDDMEGPTASQLRRERFQHWDEHKPGFHYHSWTTGLPCMLLAQMKEIEVWDATAILLEHACLPPL
jgi:hypothetical protein